MEIIVDERVDDFIETLSDKDRGRISGYLKLFKENKFDVPGRYLKKIDNNLWELRPDNIRLLFGRAGSSFVFVNVFKKNSEDANSGNTDS